MAAADEPPALDPPTLDLPPFEPPALEPPALEPPALEPPALEPPALEPPAFAALPELPPAPELTPVVPETLVPGLDVESFSMLRSLAPLNTWQAVELRPSNTSVTYLM
jgi:hypothetical protein